MSRIFPGKMFTGWCPLFSRGEQLAVLYLAFIHFISVDPQPEQALLQNQRSVEFDPPTGLGGALCLGEVGQIGLRKERWEDASP